MKNFVVFCLLTLSAGLPVNLPARFDVPGYLPLRPGETSLYDERTQAVITGKVSLDWLRLRAFERLSWKTAPESAELENGVADYFIFRRDSLFWAGRRILDRKIVDIDSTKSRLWPGFTGHNKKDSLIVRAFFQFTPPVVLGSASSAAGQDNLTYTTIREIFSGISLNSEVRVTLDSLGEVSVPAGIFDNCIRLMALLGNEELFNWVLAEGAGIIQGKELELRQSDSAGFSLREIRTAEAREDSSGGDAVLVLHENCPSRPGAAAASEERLVRTGPGEAANLDFAQLKQLLGQVRFWENFEKKMSLNPAFSRKLTGGERGSSALLTVYQPFFVPFNPFSPSSSPMRLSIPADSLGGNVTLKILDGEGRLRRTLYNGPLEPCRCDIFWDGNDLQGQALPNGKYLVRLVSGRYDSARGFVILK